MAIPPKAQFPLIHSLVPAATLYRETPDKAIATVAQLISQRSRLAELGLQRAIKLCQHPQRLQMERKHQNERLSIE